MRFRAVIFDDNEQIRDLLKQILTVRGYDVHCFADPTFCAFYLGSDCQCPIPEACADLIISDLNMITVNGLDFLENQLKKGCKIRSIALMSGSWSDASLLTAERLGCKTFSKPFTLEEITEWLDACERQIPPNRLLTPWRKC